MLNSKSHLSIKQQNEAWKKITDAVGEQQGSNIAKIHEGVAKFLTEKLYDIGSSDNYNIEIAAEIVRVRNGWGFTQLRTKFLSSQVSNDPNSSIGWHNHPLGTSFSGFISALESGYGGDIFNTLKDNSINYVARSNSTMDRFNLNSYTKHIVGWKLDEAVLYRNEVIVNKGGPYVEQIKF